MPKFRFAHELSTEFSDHILVIAKLILWYKLLMCGVIIYVLAVSYKILLEYIK